jgi:DNA-binding transcriptional ArsR family regulator
VTSSSRSLKDVLVDFAWSSWLEFGVSGWNRSQQHRYIDPEALLLLTGSLGDADPRLRDESLDWCGRYGHLLSRSRARALLKTWSAAPAWAQYAGALEIATGQSWPGAEPGLGFTPSGRSHLDTEDRPALIGLRLRAVLGVGARSEVVRILLLAAPDTWLRISEIAAEAGYTKRNVADALASLESARMVEAVRDRNALRYRLTRRAEIEALFGPVPEIKTSFLALTRALWLIADEIDRLGEAPEAMTRVVTRGTLETVDTDLWRAGIPLRDLPSGSDAFTAVLDWADHHLSTPATA